MSTKITHSAFAPPPRSWLRKMSENTMISSQIQMKNNMNQIIERKTSPTPQSQPSIAATFRIAGHAIRGGHSPCRHTTIIPPDQAPTGGSPVANDDHAAAATIEVTQHRRSE